MRQKLVKNSATEAARSKAFRMIGMQLIAVVIIALAWSFDSSGAVISALLGGIAVIVPNLYFAYRFFATGTQREPRRIVIAFYFGELTKMFISAGFAVLMIMQLAVKIAPFFCGFLGAYVGFFIVAPILMMTRMRAANR